MRIAVNTRVLLKGRMEGVCRYIHETTKRMVLAHPEDEFFFFFDRPFHPSFVYAENVTPIVITPPTRDPILWKIWFDFSIPRALKKYKIDVFLSGDTYASLKTEVPTVLVSHDLAYVHFPEHIPSRVLKYYRKNFPEFHRVSKEIIAVSEYTKSDIVQAYEVSAEKITVAHNATPEGFTPISEIAKQHILNKYTHGQPFIIYLGSIHPRKNVGRLISAFEEFKRENKKHKLILFGRKAWKFDEYERQIQKSVYRSDIIHLDGNSHNPQEILPAADLMCYISLHEGFGIPILEAMSCEVPVITSNISSMPEVAGDAALLVDPRNKKEISNAMALLTTDADLRAQLIKGGLERIKHFDWDRSARIIYSSIQKSIQE